MSQCDGEKQCHEKSKRYRVAWKGCAMSSVDGGHLLYMKLQTSSLLPFHHTFSHLQSLYLRLV